MDAGNRDKGINHEINVTPLIDVVLVLLIIFMVLTPMTQMAHDVELPDPAPRTAPSVPPPQALVLTIDRDGTMALDAKAVGREDLPQTLAMAFARQSNRQLFVKADADLRYQEVVKVLDLVKKAGTESIAIVTPRGEDQALPAELPAGP